MDKLTHQECVILADVLGDTPTTVISVGRLKQGMCHAYVAGTLPHITAALVFDAYCPDEPCGFGTNPDILWQMLKCHQRWDCINVNSACAEPLGKLIKAETSNPIRYYGDVFHALLKPVHCPTNTVVRLLTLADAERLAKAPAEVQGSGYKTHQAMLTEGIVAAAIVAGGIVSIAHTYSQTDLHADIGVSTLEKWQGKGFAAAAASLVAQQIQARGKVPVWSCGEDNAASLRVAQKLGFTEVERRTYVIPVV